MEMKKPKSLTSFIVNSKGRCFFCLAEETSSSSDLLSPDADKQVKGQPVSSLSKSTPSHSLQYLSRFLGMDTSQVLIEKVLIPPRFRRKVEGSQLKVSLCPGCASLNGRLRGMCRKLEKIELEVATFLEGIREKLKSVPGRAEESQKWRAGPRSSRREEWDLKLVETLRAETMRKCSHKLLEKQPRVKVPKLTVDQVRNEKCRKFKDAAGLRSRLLPTTSAPGSSSSSSQTPGAGSSHPRLQQLLWSPCNPLHSTSPKSNLVQLSYEDLAGQGGGPFARVQVQVMDKKTEESPSPSPNMNPDNSDPGGINTVRKVNFNRVKRIGQLPGSSQDDYILPDSAPLPNHIDIGPVKAEHDHHPQPVPQVMEVHEDGDSHSSPEIRVPAEVDYDYDDYSITSHPSSSTGFTVIVPTGSAQKNYPMAKMGIRERNERERYRNTLTFSKDRSLRKKVQDCRAATRYRKKKREELAVLLAEEANLQTVHDELEMEKGKLESEIRGVRGLLMEVVQAGKHRGRRTSPHRINGIEDLKFSNQNYL